MANASTVRQWARENGHGTVRGKLPASVTTAWDDAHPDDPYQVHQVNGSISADEMDDFFPGPDGPGSSVDDGYDTSEVKPSRPAARTRAKGAPARAGGWPWGRKSSKPGRKAPKPPRVGTEDLWAAAWRFGAKIATPLPPLYRVLRVQSVVAGPLIEDAVKDTVIDTFAQPLARLQGAGKTVNALLGPPVIISMMAFHASQQQARGADPNPLIMTFGEEALRSSLITLLDIGGPKFEQAVARERDQEERLGMSVDAFMAWLWTAPPSTPAEQEEEEARFRHIVHADEPATM